MPPKVKTTRETILQAAFEVAKGEGLGGITAQSVSARLQTSVAPIFREFQTMEELRGATAEKITEFHTDYIQSYPLAGSEFLSFGLAYIHFAKEYPRFFELIMQPCPASIGERLSGPLSFAVHCAGRESGLDGQQARDLFFNIWIYTHGIACLVYMGSLAMTQEEEKELLLNAFDAFLNQLRQKRPEMT